MRPPQSYDRKLEIVMAKKAKPKGKKIVTSSGAVVTDHNEIIARTVRPKWAKKKK